VVNLESGNTVDARKTIKPTIKPRTKDHHLKNPLCQSLGHNIVDEACSSDGRCSCTWGSSVRIPSDRYCQERNSAKNSGSSQRWAQKVDCEWIREEPTTTRTGRLHRTVKGHVFSSSTGSLRLHLGRQEWLHSAYSWVRRIVVAPRHLKS